MGNEKEAEYIKMLKDKDTLIGLLMLDVGMYKKQMKKIKSILKKAHNEELINDDQYIKLMELISD